MYYINTRKQGLRTAITYEHNKIDETFVADRHRCHMGAKFGVFVDEDHCHFPMLYLLPKLYIQRVLLLFLVHVLLLSCLYF